MNRHNKTLFQLIKEEASKQEASNGSQTMKIRSNNHQEEEEEREKDEADTNGVPSPQIQQWMVKDSESCNGWLELGKKEKELYFYTDQEQQQQEHKEAQAQECLHLLRFGHGRPCLEEGGEVRLETAARLDMMELRLFHAQIERDMALTHVHHSSEACHDGPMMMIDSYYCPASDSHARNFFPHCFYSIEQCRSSGIHLGFHSQVARHDCGSDHHGSYHHGSDRHGSYHHGSYHHGSDHHGSYHHGSDHCNPRTSTSTGTRTRTSTRTSTRTRTRTTTTTTTSSTTKKSSPFFYAAPSFQGATPVV
mgnify:CR=1 FL=1